MSCNKLKGLRRILLKKGTFDMRVALVMPKDNMLPLRGKDIFQVTQIGYQKQIWGYFWGYLCFNGSMTSIFS